MTDELIARLEAATGPDRELDAAIAAFLAGGTVAHDGHFWKPGVRGFCIAPRYTASIDAALTLVDQRALWAVGNMEEGVFARLCWPNSEGHYIGGYFGATGAGPALAICIAALKAKENSRD